MASFLAYLQVRGRQYTVLHADFGLHQFTDSLGRPASPTLGGAFTLELETPPAGDVTLEEWMVDPAMEQNGQVLLRDRNGGTLKVIKFYNAYLVDMQAVFDATGQAGAPSGSLRTQVRISPQAVRVGSVFHDNDWPGANPIVDWDWTQMDAQCKPATAQPGAPSGMLAGVQTALDVLGLVPVVGELADAANAALYLAQGDMANAALSASSMIPIVGNVTGAAKLAGKASAVVKNPLFEKLAKSFKEGWSPEKVLDIPKGQRPAPSEYLDNDYTAEHLAKFKEEGGGFIVVKSWTENGRFGQLPPRKFVGLNSEMDDVIREYEEKGKDWTVLRDRLNLGPDTDLSAEEIYHVRIDKTDSRFSYEMPSGNEPGAISGEWMPGGFTKNGTQEAALIGSENCVHNKDVHQLLDFFGKDKTTRIK